MNRTEKVYFSRTVYNANGEKEKYRAVVGDFRRPTFEASEKYNRRNRIANAVYMTTMFAIMAVIAYAVIMYFA